jgi:hypothetical protein
MSRDPSTRTETVSVEMIVLDCAGHFYVVTEIYVCSRSSIQNRAWRSSNPSALTPMACGAFNNFVTRQPKTTFGRTDPTWAHGRVINARIRRHGILQFLSSSPLITIKLNTKVNKRSRCWSFGCQFVPNAYHRRPERC